MSNYLLEEQKNEYLQKFAGKTLGQGDVVVANLVFRTSNYDLFKKLTENRGICRNKVEEIKRSIKRVGYASRPILVTTSMEIYDGQHCFIALKELGMEVPFVIVSIERLQRLHEQ